MRLLAVLKRLVVHDILRNYSDEEIRKMRRYMGDDGCPIERRKRRPKAKSLIQFWVIVAIAYGTGVAVEYPVVMGALGKLLTLLSEQ